MSIIINNETTISDAFENGVKVFKSGGNISQNPFRNYGLKFGELENAWLSGFKSLSIKETVSNVAANFEVPEASELVSPYLEGQSVASSGMAIQANPYRNVSDKHREHEAWRSGWISKTLEIKLTELIEKIQFS